MTGSFSYLKKKGLSLLIATFVSGISFFIESTLISFSGKYNLMLFNPPRFNSMICLLLFDTLFYCSILLIKFIFDIMTNRVIFSLWISAFTLPLSICFLLSLTLFFNKYSFELNFFILLLCILIINALAVYGYNKSSEFLKAKSDAEISAYHYKLYENQLNIIKESEKTIHKIKHDMKNHLITIDILVKNNSVKEASDYIHTLTGNLNSDNEFSKTGNIVIDSLINHKLHTAKKLQAEIHSNVFLPAELEISSLDLTVILGNLLDNAIEAIQKLDPGKRKIFLDARYSKGRFMIKLSNTYDGQIISNNKKLVTTKDSESIHGFGLSNVKDSLKKYDGQMKIDYTTTEFTVSLLCFC